MPADCRKTTIVPLFKKSLLGFILVFGVSGCALMSNTSKEQLITSGEKAQYCLSDSAGEIELRTRNFFNRCMGPVNPNSPEFSMIMVNGVSVPMKWKHNYEIDEEKIPNGTRFIHKSKEDDNYLFAADVTTANPSCGTSLQLYAKVKRAADHSFDVMYRSIKENTDECPPKGVLSSY
jgi:hypothetical protein